MMVVEASLDGHLPVQRRIGITGPGFEVADDMLLTRLDPAATTVAFQRPIEIARGSQVRDADGSRRPLLLFSRGTQATAVLPDGREEPLPRITVRATEYTVGNDAPDAMPGRLPSESGMTYAVELSVDEAMAVGAREVRFSQPVIQLVDNFLGFPVGQIVPAGSYDRENARWEAEPNGRVIAVVGESGGRASLDVDGSGRPAGADALAALGIGDAELTRLARALPGGVRRLTLGPSETTFSHRRGVWTAETRVGGRTVAKSVTREERGRVVEERWTLGGVTEIRRHRYDDTGRLVETTVVGGNTSSYGWDERGRRTAHGPDLARVDDDGRLLAEGDDRVWTWNDAGQLARRTLGGKTTAFAHDALDRLRSATLPDGRRITYLLDGLGRRVGRRVDGQLERGWVIGEGAHPLAELDGEGRLRARFVYVRRRRVADAMLVGDRAFLLLTDVRGSVRAVVDAADGRVVQKISFDPFGRVLEDINPGFQPFGFAGGIYDPDTGLVHVGMRDLDPEAGRFTTADPAFPATGELTAYAYAGGDPISQIDPTGLDWASVFSRQTMLDAYDAGVELATGAGDVALGGANPLRWKETIDSWRRVEQEIDNVRKRNPYDCTSLYHQSIGDRTKTFDMRNEAMWRPMTGWDLAEVGAEHYFVMASDLNAGETLLGSTRLYAYGLPLLYGVAKQSVFLRTTMLNTSMLRSIGDPLTDESRSASPPNVILDLYVAHKAHSEYSANGQCSCR